MWVEAGIYETLKLLAHKIISTQAQTERGNNTLWHEMPLCVSLTKTSLLVMYRETITVYFENHTKHTNVNTNCTA